MTCERDVRGSEPVGCQDLSQGVLAVPTGVLRVHVSMTTEAIDKVADVEGVRCGENQPTTGVQMSADAPEEPSHIVEVLNQLTREDHVELPVQIEIAGVTQSRVVALGLQRFYCGVVDVDPDDVGDLVGEKAVEPVWTPVTGCTTNIEQRPSTDQGPYDFKAITQGALSPRSVTPLRLKEVPLA